MKRTIQEVYEIIKEKRENARIDLERIFNVDGKPSDIARQYKTIGYIEAYTDVIALIESSHLIDQPNLTEITAIKLTDEEREMINKSLREWGNQPIQIELKNISKDN